MLGKLLPFELKLHFNQVGFWITVAILVLFGVLASSTDFLIFSGGGGEKVKANGALTVAFQTGFLGFLSLLFGSIYVVSGMMRDEASKSLEIIHATPVSTFDMTASRMIGVYLATFVSSAAGVIGLFAGQFMPWADAEKFGPVDALNYLQPLITLIAVNALIVTAVFTAVAALTRNRTLVYVSAIGFMIIYFSVQLFVGENASDLMTSLSDPFGLSAASIATEFWPAEEQNTRRIPLIGYFGLNRLVWLAFAIGVLAVIFRFFRRGLIGGRTKGAGTIASDARRSVAIVQPVKPLATGAFAAAWSRCKLEYLSAVKSIAFLVLAGLSAALFALTIFVQASFAPEPLLPSSALLAQSALGSAALPLLIMIVFFGGEIFWRDSTYRMTELIDSTRVQNISLLAGKWAALFGVVLTILSAAFVVALIAQLILGKMPVNIGTMLQLIFVDFAPSFLLHAALVLFIQNFMPNRIVGMIAAAGVIVGLFFFLDQLPFEHPLIRYGSLPNGGFSEMNGFASLLSFGWFSLYWGSLATLFAVVSAWLWRRGIKPSFLKRLRGQGGRPGPITMATGAVALLGFAGSGAAIYKGYSIENKYTNTIETEKEMAQYETRLGARLKDPVPKIRDVSVSANFYPETQTARFSGSYRIENSTGQPITELFISLPSFKEKTVRQLDLAGAARVTEGEIADFLKGKQARLYRFSPALAPGAFTTLAFDLETLPPEIGDNSNIRRNGTFVNSGQVLPSLGLPDARLTNPDKRRKYKLPELEKRPDRTDMAARQLNFFDRSSDYVNFSATVCTAPGQFGVAPGRMVKEYERDGRACRDYKPVEPIAHFFAFVSAKYDLAEDVWTGPKGERIPLAIYYHRDHGANTGLMLEAMKQAFTTFTREFGPYQYTDIRILEFPYASFAQSFAGTIPFSENIGFMRDPGKKDDPKSIDLATYVTLHEIGHQWFGHQIMPADVKGFNVLSEGITEHAAMTAYEDVYGWAKARRLVEKRSIENYLLMRTLDKDDEPPLALAEGQQYLDYNKASWVFWGMKHTIGEEKINAGLRNFLAEYGRKGPPYPTTLDLTNAIRKEAGPEYDQLISDYWDRITLWELSVKPDTFKTAPSGAGLKASLTINLDKKVASEETGKEVSVTESGEALNEWVEIGFYTEDPQEVFGAGWKALERVRLTQKETALSFDVPAGITHVVLDPRRLLIERLAKDNAASVK